MEITILEFIDFFNVHFNFEKFFSPIAIPEKTLEAFAKPSKIYAIKY